MSVDAKSEVLTFLIADVRGYTSYTHTYGDDAAARLAAAFAEIAREGVEAHGGEVIELRGDEALAVFGSAAEALRAAVDLQLIFADEVELHPALPLRVGIGVDSGPAVPVEGGYRGGALNLAARLCSKAGPGEVLASDGAVRGAGAVDGLTVHPHGVFEMKGLAEPVSVSRVSLDGMDPDTLKARFDMDGHVEPAASEVPSALDTTTPIVGRDREIHRLRWAWRRARRREGSALLVVGPPGIGKTRLIAELGASVAHDGASVSYLTAHDRGHPADVDRDTPTLFVLDDVEEHGVGLEMARSLWARVEGTRALVIVAMSDSALTEESRAFLEDAGDAVVRPAPLDVDGVREVAALYLGESADALPASLLESTGGVPRRIHRQVSEWAFAEASRRAGAAASRAAAGRSDLRSVESELAGNVVDLQLIRERTRRYGSSDRRPEGELLQTPFKGLASFDVGDADLFFGRERLVAELVARLVGAPLLGVVGPSGSGKSSAIRAGLVPAIRSGVLPGSDDWRVAVLRPGEHPLHELDEALSGVGADAERTLLVVDQFEEVFTCAPTRRNGRHSSVRSSEGAWSGKAVSWSSCAPADFYGRCAEEPAARGAARLRTMCSSGPMGRDEYRRAIEQPAASAWASTSSPRSSRRSSARSRAGRAALPLLSTALLELWERRDGRTIRLWPPTSRRVASAARSGASPRRSTAGFTARNSRRSRERRCCGSPVPATATRSFAGGFLWSSSTPDATRTSPSWWAC